MDAVEDAVNTLPEADKVTSEDREEIEDALEIIEDILKEEKPAVKVFEKVELVEETNKAEVAEVKEEMVEKPVYSRKRNYKVEVE
jgi:50S ribosomal subunit-associated GTPase HflX